MKSTMNRNRFKQTLGLEQRLTQFADYARTAAQDAPQESNF
jgi:hypothetical protein